MPNMVCIPRVAKRVEEDPSLFRSVQCAFDSSSRELSVNWQYNVLIDKVSYY